jgi:hypothetical protein
MNRQTRRMFLSSLDGMVAETTKRWQTWKDRWDAYCGLMQAMAGFGRDHGVSQKEICEEFAGEMARRLVDALGAPPITDVYQSLLYFGSSAPPHNEAARQWNLTHQDELMEFQRRYPDVPLLGMLRQESRAIH